MALTPSAQRTRLVVEAGAPGGGTLRSCAIRFVSCLLAALPPLVAAAPPGAADDFHTPSLTALRADWRAALDQLRSEVNAHPQVSGDFVFATRRAVPRFDARAWPVLVQLNAISSQFFTGIGRSSVPVLLPFDAAGWL